jgi:hypothetical protein
VPLNSTVFNEGLLLKFVPVMVMIAPNPPLFGVKLEMVGVPNTVKLFVLLMVTPLNDTEIGPEPAEEGTDVVMLVAVKEFTMAGTSLNSTIGAEMKFVPVIVIVVPTPAAVGLKLLMVGEGNTVKLAALVTVTPLTVTVITPDIAPAGTVVVKLLTEEAVTTAVLLLLNFTTWSVGVVLKLLPDIVMVAPTAPLAGLNPEMAGVGKTMKLDALVIVTPAVVTEMGPVVAPTGTVVTILLVFEVVMVALIPLNDT